MRIKYIKGQQKGLVLKVTPAEGLELIRTGQAILTKDMNSDDYHTSGEKNVQTRKITS